MKIKTYQIKLLNNLLNYNFAAPQARARNRFVKVLVERSNEFELYRKTLLEEVCNKDNDGKPVIINDNYDIPEDKLSEFKNKYEELVSEEFEIIPSNNLSAEDIIQVKELIRNTNREMSVEETDIYEEILENL